MGRTSFAKKDRSSALKLCGDFCGVATAEVARHMKPKTPVRDWKKDTRNSSKGTLESDSKALLVRQNITSQTTCREYEPQTANHKQNSHH
jgi:hypothetical protein